MTKGDEIALAAFFDQAMTFLLSYKSNVSATWLSMNQQPVSLLNKRPVSAICLAGGKAYY